MRIRTRKFFGTIALLVLVVVWSLLGMTVGCAQCHNHRYDPIAQTDYYRFRALFEPRGVVVAGASSHPGKFGFCFAEDEDTPWTTLADGLRARLGAMRERLERIEAGSNVQDVLQGVGAAVVRVQHYGLLMTRGAETCVKTIPASQSTGHL